MEQFPQINPAVFDKSVSTIMTERKWWPGDWHRSIFGGNENEKEDDDDKGMEISNTDFRALSDFRLKFPIEIQITEAELTSRFCLGFRSQIPFPK